MPAITILNENALRRADTEITICDLTGTGVQDTAIATLARQRAQAVGAGRVFNS